jgi:hypothetical protein
LYEGDQYQRSQGRAPSPAKVRAHRADIEVTKHAMSLSTYNHYRHGHHPLTWTAAASAEESKTWAVMPEAIECVESAIHQGKLITPQEAMALAGGAARDTETLYSIARKLSFRRDLDLESLLAALTQRFPGYS